MNRVKIQDYIIKAKSVAIRKKLSQYSTAGDVGCALVTDKGSVYLGTSIDMPCGIGFCAEASAIASMVTNKETRIKAIVAVNSKGKVIPPCGRCREFIYQVNPLNADTKVILSLNKTEKLSKLLPNQWEQSW